MDINYMTDDQLMDLEANAEQTVILWNDMSEEHRVQSILSNNDMHQAYCTAKEILREIENRMQAELEEVWECQSVK